MHTKTTNRRYRSISISNHQADKWRTKTRLNQNYRIKRKSLPNSFQPVLSPRAPRYERNLCPLLKRMRKKKSKAKLRNPLTNNLRM
jgi:hypothetical protein